MKIKLSLLKLKYILIINIYLIAKYNNINQNDIII